MRQLAMILFVTLTTLGGQFLIKDAVVAIAARDPAPSGLGWSLAVAMEPRVWASIGVQGLGFLAWAAVLSRMQLGPAYATFGAFFYILLAVSAWWYYGERLAPLQWAGGVLVSAGVLLMSAPAARA